MVDVTGEADPQLRRAGERVISGNIAARIDRLPLTRIQYTLAAITQMFWGLIIDTDGMVARLYPFLWEGKTLSTFEYSLIYGANTGAGITIGCYAGGYLSDRFGRRKILIAAAIIDAVFLWPIAHTNSFGPLLLWNLLFAIGMGFVLATNAVYLHEIAPPTMRHRISMRTQLITGVCALLPAIMGIFLIPDHYQWYIYILAAVQIVVLVPLGLSIPESPRWLEAKGRTEEADRIVSGWERKIEARFGPLPPANAAEHTVIQTDKVPASELFKGVYKKRTTILFIVWFLGYPGIIYGGGAFMTTYLVEKNWTAPQLFFWVTTVGAIVKVAVFYLSSFIGERYERRHMILVSGILFAAAYLLLLVIGGKVGQGILAVSASSLTSLWLFNMYNYTATSYPTRLRSVGTGWTDGLGHIGTFLGPLLIGPLYAWTAGSGHWGWIVWVTVPCALLPSLLIGTMGINQRGRVLEKVST